MGPKPTTTRRIRAALAAAALGTVAAATLLSPLPAAAQTAAPAQNAVIALTEIPTHPPNMTSTQLQGVGCIALGVVTAAGTMYYSTSVTLASFASSWGVPLLAIPVAAGGYAVGCSVGSTTAPGVYWIYAWLTRH